MINAVVTVSIFVFGVLASWFVDRRYDNIRFASFTMLLFTFVPFTLYWVVVGEWMGVVLSGSFVIFALITFIVFFWFSDIEIDHSKDKDICYR